MTLALLAHRVPVAVTGMADATFDDFSRSVGSGWGTASPSGEVWTTFLSESSVALVDGTTGLLWAVGSSAVAAASVAVPVNTVDGFSMLALIQIGNPELLDGSGLAFRVGNSGGTVELRLGALMTTSMRITTDDATYVLAALPTFVDGIEYWMRIAYTASYAAARFWEDGSTEPGTWDIEIANANAGSSEPCGLSIVNGLVAGSIDLPLYVESIDFRYPLLAPGLLAHKAVVEATRLYVTDGFERIVGFGLGTSDMGLFWNGGVMLGFASVDGHEAVLACNGGGATSQVVSYLGGSGGIGETRPYTGGRSTITFSLDVAALTASDLSWLLEFQTVVVDPSALNILITHTDSRIRWSFGASDGTAIPVGFWADWPATYTLSIFEDAGVLTASITDGTDTYAVTYGGTPTEARVSMSQTLTQVFPFTPSYKIVYIREIVVPEFSVGTPGLLAHKAIVNVTP